MTRDLPTDGSLTCPNRIFAGSVRSISALVILGRFSGSGVMTITGFGVSVGVVTTGVGVCEGAGVVAAAGFSVCSGCAGGGVVAIGTGCFWSGAFAASAFFSSVFVSSVFVSSVLEAAGFSGCGAGAVTTGVGVCSGAFAAAGFSVWSVCAGGDALAAGFGAGSSCGLAATGASALAGGAVAAGLVVSLLEASGCCWSDAVC